MVRKPFAQVAGDDALNPFIDLFDPLLGAHTQPRPSQQAQAKRRQQTQRESLTDDVGNLPRFVDLTSDNQRVAAWRFSRDRADDANLPSCRQRLNDRNVSDNLIGLKFGWKLRHVAGDLAAVRAEQSAIVNAAGVLLQILINRIQLSFARQACNEVQLTGNHGVGSGDQVIVDAPIDEAEQPDDKNCEHTGYREGPVKSARTHELPLKHRISLPGSPARRQRWRIAPGHRNLTVPCEE